MTYIDAKVSRNLAGCAMALFSILCLLEIANVVVTGRRIASGPDRILTMIDALPILERLLLRTSADTLRGIAVVHGIAAFAMMAAYGWLTLSFSRRPGIVKAAAMSGILALAPVTSIAEQATRIVVDLHRGANAYDLAMSSGDGTVGSSNRKALRASAVQDLTLGFVSLQSNRAGLRIFPPGPAGGAGGTTLPFPTTVAMVEEGRVVFGYAYHAVLAGTAALLFGWTVRNRLAVRRRRSSGIPTIAA